MHDDDERPRPARHTLTLGAPLDTASIGDMKDYIAALEAEIARVRAELDRRSDHRAAAEALFKKRSEADDA